MPRVIYKMAGQNKMNHIYACDWMNEFWLLLKRMDDFMHLSEIEIIYQALAQVLLLPTFFGNEVKVK